MEEFDIFTNEIEFTKTGFNNILSQFANGMPSTPNSANYESCKKLQAEESLARGDYLDATFCLTEAVSSSLRSITLYRNDQLKTQNGDKLQAVQSYLEPMHDLLSSMSLSKEDKKLCPFLKQDIGIQKNLMNKCIVKDDMPLHEKYLQFSSVNNTKNLRSILKELPKEWTIVQLTAPYNPNENLKPLDEFKTEISSIYLSVLTNDYIDCDAYGAYTMHLPANSVKEGENPLFVELYSLLDDNYKTIEKPHLLNNKRLLKNYWDKREEIDLRLKSVINVMDREWLGGWKCLLNGRLVDTTIKSKIKKLVDDVIADWGFIQLTKMQRTLFYNLIEGCHWLSSTETKITIRKILTECGNLDQMKSSLNNKGCIECNEEFKFLNELCVKCLAKGFEAIHKCTLVDGIKAFSETVSKVKDSHSRSDLKMAKRHPVILIVDELLDTFPWESLPILNIHPVSRIENIHFLYYLYKIHEKNITDGYFAAKPESGRYIINPEQNLDRMEKRMTSFVQYWCPEWIGDISKPPAPDIFVDYLKEADMFLYCGHGSGCQFASGAKGGGVEGARGGRAAALLSGCGSVRLTRPGGRAPSAGAHHYYHIATSPMVVGMLWEVTDLEVDKLVSTLLALYIPSNAPVTWDKVGKSQWSSGILETNVEQDTFNEKRENPCERDLLRAIALSRRSTKYIMIAMSVVARGIPIRIIDTKT